ncbi:monocarboxylate transporter 13-like [Diadema antillarum]|uniref:monocarboxylate transporter 13-like n=1 Tax=Diadema antillarum TaxID=105358 RepID=UPI003A89860C
MVFKLQAIMTCKEGCRAGLRERLDRFWGWLVVLATWSSLFVSFGFSYAFGLFFIEFQREFKSSATVTGWVGSASLSLSLLAALPVKLVIERVGYRLVGVVSVILMTSGLLLTSFMPGIAPMFVSYSLLFGLGQGAFHVASLSLTSSISTKASNSKEAFIPDMPNVCDNNDAVDSGLRSGKAAEDINDDRPKLWRQILQALRYPELWTIGLAVSYMVSVGFTETQGSSVISVMGVTCFVGKILLVIGGEWVPFPTLYLLVINIAISAGVMAALLVVETMVPMLIIGGVVGCTLGMSSTLVYTLPQKFFGPAKADSTWAIIIWCNGLGYLLSSVIGQSIDRHGSYVSGIWGFIGMYVVAGALYVISPVYQKISAPERYILMELHRQRNEDKPSQSSRNEPLLAKDPDARNVIVERLSSV